MIIFALAGGTPPICTGDLCSCCGYFWFPLLALLIVKAIIKKSWLITIPVFIVSIVPYMFIRSVVLKFEPDTDFEIIEIHDSGRWALKVWSILAAAGIWLLIVVTIVRFIAWFRVTILGHPPANSVLQPPL